jgi:hypothetical protein
LPSQKQKLQKYYQQKETNLSPNWPLPQQYNKYKLGRMGRSYDERISIEAKKELQQEQKGHSPPSPRPSCCSSNRENKRGFLFLRTFSTIFK